MVSYFLYHIYIFWVHNHESYDTFQDIRPSSSHPATRLRFTKHRSPLRIRPKTFHGRKGPQLLDVELRPQGSTRTRANGDFVKHETAFLEILPTFIRTHVHLRDVVPDDANVIHVQVLTCLCDLTSTAQKERRATICHFNTATQGWLSVQSCPIGGLSEVETPRETHR